ncbi:MAG: SulP family sulfate permease, partial [Myxococcota bacterium]
MAAATITLVGIPQCLAYAMMAGLPPAYGLVTAAIPGLVAALAGRSTQLVTGPTNTTGLLVLAAVTPWLADTGFVTTEGLTVVATLAVLAGLVRLGLAAVGGAALVRFLPESVLAGFTAGAGLLIGVMQLDEALGLPAISAGGLIDAVLGLGRDWTSGARPTTAAALVTAGTIGAILLVKKVRPKWPAALLGVVAAGLASAALGLSAETGLVLINERSPMPQGWPLIAMPSTDLSLWRQLLVPACAIVLLGTLELAVTARADGARPSMRR